MRTSPAPEPAAGDARSERRIPTAASKPSLGDAALATILAGVAIAGLALSPPQPEFRDPDVAAGALAVGQSLPLALRRLTPGRVLVAVWVATAAHLLLDYPPSTPVFVGAIVATYGVAAYGAGRAQVAGGLFVAGTLAALATAAWLSDGSWRLVDFSTGALVFLVAWVLGDRARTRRAYTAALEDRALRLERDREAEAAAAVLDERNRMARELHDVIAHGVSVIVVQATAARRVLPADVPAAAEALSNIEAAGRTALGELRTLLGTLHGDEPDVATMAPQPGLAALPELLERTRGTGLPVELRVAGERRPLPSGVDLSAYRVVQEALTNVLKHAPGAHATVAIRHEADRLHVEITDDGGSALIPGGDGTGRGLIGMRERVLLLGGDLHAEPRPTGGFAVRAVFPLDLPA